MSRSDMDPYVPVAPSEKGESPIKRPKKILLVDDEQDIAEVFKAVLERDGEFSVDMFTDPVKAMMSFQAGKYDLAILDVRMRAMNGVELYQRLSAIDHHLKVCFATAASWHDFTAAFPQLSTTAIASSSSPSPLSGAHFINKPTSANNLVQKIRMVLLGNTGANTS